MTARGTIRGTKLNRTEQEYGTMLRARQLTGEIAWFAFEAVTLKLADDTRYTPDFALMLADGTIELIEVKGGFMRDDARVKLKVAARLFPFVFRLARKTKDGWSEELV
jgi:hypothetical protein